MNNKQSVINNFFWRFMERCGAQGVTFVVSIILARLLDPSVYGTVALVSVFMLIMQVFVDSGMGNALIQKKDTDDLDFSSVFWFNIAMCTLLYLIMFFAAPFISSFYGIPELTLIVRVMSLMLIISGMKNIQQAYVSRHMMFRIFFFTTLGGTVIAAIVGIAMAYMGFGVWALVAQMLVNAFVDTVILWITVKWRPKTIFSMSRLKGLFSYGWKLLISSVLDTVYNELRQLIIGKIYTPADLAQFNQGQKFPQFTVVNINASIDSVLLPTMSKAQDNPAAIRSMTRRAIKTSTYLMMPFMVGLAVCAEPAVRLIITDKWLPCVPYLRIFCFSFAFYPIHTANLNAIKAMGRSDLFLILEILKKVVGLTAILSTMWISVMAMAYSMIFTSVICQIINAWPNKKLLGYSYLNQVADMLPQIGMSLAMGVAVYGVQFFGMNDILTLCVQVPLGMLLYWAMSKVFRVESYTYVIGTAKEFLGKHKMAEN